MARKVSEADALKGRERVTAQIEALRDKNKELFDFLDDTEDEKYPLTPELIDLSETLLKIKSTSLG